MTNIIERSWEAYRAIALPNAKPEELDEHRRTFFAGAGTLFYGMLFRLESGGDATVSDETFMQEIHVEIDSAGADIDRKVIDRLARELV